MGRKGTPWLPDKKFIPAACRCLTAAIFIFSLLIIFHCGHDRCRVENLGLFVHPDRPDIVGMDGCASIVINDSILLWTFGDTIIGRFKEAKTAAATFEEKAVMKGMLRNSFAFTGIPDDSTIDTLSFRFHTKKGLPAELLVPENPGDHHCRIWPVDGIQLGRRLFLYYYRVTITGKKDDPFLFRGTGIATWDVPEKWKIGDAIALDRGKLIFGGDDPAFGDSVTSHDGWLIIAGHRKRDNAVSAYLCRVKREDILRRKRYQFLNESGGWSDNIKDAAGFFHDVAGELSLTYNSILGKFIFIYSSMKGSIKMVQAANPEEALSAQPITLYQPPPLPAIESRTFMMYYSGKEIFHTKKALYAVFIDPAIYQPTLLRIPYCALMGNSR